MAEEFSWRRAGRKNLLRGGGGGGSPGQGKKDQFSLHLQGLKGFIKLKFFSFLNGKFYNNTNRGGQKVLVTYLTSFIDPFKP